MFETNSFSTNRLQLRPFKRSDLEVFIEMSQDSDVQKYFEEISSSIAHISEFFNLILSQNKKYDESFAIVSKDSLQVIGYISFFSMPPATIIVEYIITRPYRKNNYAQEALAGILSYVKQFRPYVTTALFKVNKSNIASQKVLEKFGAIKTEMDNDNYEFSIIL